MPRRAIPPGGPFLLGGRPEFFGGTDHRLLWSVGMGVPPAKLHEKRWGRRFRLPTLDDPSRSGWQAEAPAPPTWFFDPVILRGRRLVDRRQETIVCPRLSHL